MPGGGGGASPFAAAVLDAAGFDITCEFPEVVTRAITLSTTSKKWVYAFVESGAIQCGLSRRAKKYESC